VEVLADLLGVFAQTVECLFLDYGRSEEATGLVLDNLACFRESDLFGYLSLRFLLRFDDAQLSLINPYLTDEKWLAH
jgi:hypothetical protein